MAEDRKPRPEIQRLWDLTVGRPSQGPEDDLHRVIGGLSAILDGILGRLDAIEARLDREDSRLQEQAERG